MYRLISGARCQIIANESKVVFEFSDGIVISCCTCLATRLIPEPVQENSIIPLCDFSLRLLFLIWVITDLRQLFLVDWLPSHIVLIRY